MSFRNRLALFFVLIVIVPMLAVAFLLLRLIDESAQGQAEAAISQRHTFASTLFREQRERAGAAITELKDDRVFASALLQGDVDRARRRAQQLLDGRRLERIVFVQGGKTLVRVGDKRAIAPAVRDVVSGGKPVGTLGVAVIDAPTYVDRVRALAGLRATVINGGKVLATTLPHVPLRELPTASGAPLTVDGVTYRVQNFADDGSFGGQKIRVYTFGDPAAITESTTDEKLFALAVLLGFFVLAIACAVLVSRTLQSQIAEFLAAARRLAGGDFSARVPTAGRDEFAELGEEFNKMALELERRLAELRHENARVQSSMLRLGDAVGQNLDRDALLQIILDTAVDGVGADAGRACMTVDGGGRLQERSRVGDMNGLEGAVLRVEGEAMSSGVAREAMVGEAYAIAHPLRSSGGRDEVIGVIAIGRNGRPFTAGDRELLTYLSDRAGRSMVNVERHEAVARESVTDELTGLSNRRAYEDKLTGEIERARRFGEHLGLVIMDLDKFKQINDTYGHAQGDEVLRAVARVLRETSREVDTPARYGGEELLVLLPNTDLEGGYNRAERVRQAIEQLHIPLLDGSGTMRVTTSCGVASMQGTQVDARALFKAADAALYDAKRDGRNMSVRAR